MFSYQNVDFCKYIHEGQKIEVILMKKIKKGKRNIFSLIANIFQFISSLHDFFFGILDPFDIHTYIHDIDRLHVYAPFF